MEMPDNLPAGGSPSKERLEQLLPLLRQKAEWTRRETIRIHGQATETRIASALSCVELFVALYYAVLAHDPGNPGWEGRDRFVISKGHGAMSLYPILCNFGYVPESELQKVCGENALLGAIPDSTLPGIDCVGGSLGHALGIACGMSLALKDGGQKEKVFALLGDGELNEGSVWEAIMFAGARKLANLVALIDHNRVSMLDYCANIIDLAPIDKKLRGFGWDVTVVDGHDLSTLLPALLRVKTSRSKRPKAVVAVTVKGKGVPRLEIDPLCHVKSLTALEVNELLRREN
jgi:transketolase